MISILRESIDDWDGEWAEAYWAWKFEPHGPGRIWVGDDGGRGRIAGCYIWNPVRLRFGDTMFVVFENDAAKLPELLARRGAADPPRWSLVPSDHDSM